VGVIIFTFYFGGRFNTQNTPQLTALRAILKNPLTSQQVADNFNLAC